MKLRKQTPAKAVIVVAAAGLAAALFALIRSEPRLAAEPEPARPPPDFERMFVPQSGTPAAVEPLPTRAPHTRTHAS